MVEEVLMKLIKISILALILLLVTSVSVQPTVQASEENEKVIRPTIERTPSLQLNQETLSVEYGEEVVLEDLIISGYWDQLILPQLDTTQLGNHTVFLIAKQGLNEVKVSLDIEIADTTPPEFDEKISTLSLDYNEEVDLLDWFEASDNTGGKVTLSQNLEIENTKPGKQTITVIAQDESGNENSHDVVVTVKEKPKPKPKAVVVVPSTSNNSLSDTSSNSNDRFNAKVTYYGVDCYGCYMDSSGQGYTASGVRVSTTGVYQNGSWVPGITYKGYYIFAAGRQYAYCTIIDIYNHGIVGQGISPDTPIRGIVLDRGGGVSGNHFDVFIGNQRSSGVRHVRANPQAQVVGHLAGCY